MTHRIIKRTVYDGRGKTDAVQYMVQSRSWLTLWRWSQDEFTYATYNAALREYNARIGCLITVIQTSE